MSIESARLKRNAQGVFEVHWSEKGVGRYHSRRVSTRTTNRIEATAFLKDFVAAQLRLDEVRKDPTVDYLISRYSSSMAAKNVGETQFICLHHLREFFGEMRLVDLTDKRLLAYREARGVTDGTLRRELGTLRAVIGHALKHKLIKHDDAPHIDLPRPSQPRTVYLDEAQQRDFLQLALEKGSSRLGRFVALALLTGARKQAILGLKWSQVDMLHGFIEYRDEAGQQHNKRRVPVPMNKRLKELMQRFYKEKKTDYVLDHAGPIRHDWERWIETTPYRHIHIHDLRRSFVTLLVMKGAPINTIAAITGDNPATLLAHYAHYAPTSGASVVGLLD